MGHGGLFNPNKAAAIREKDEINRAKRKHLPEREIVLESYK